MFKRLDNKAGKAVSITIDGIRFEVPAGESVAAAVLASGFLHTRTTSVSGSPRAPYCLMGACYECLMIINGRANQRACKVVVEEGMSIQRQLGPGERPL